MLRYFALFLLTLFISCNDSPGNINSDNLLKTEPLYKPVKGALLSTNYKSLEELRAVIQIEYFKVDQKKPMVRLTHLSNGQDVTSILESGISDLDITNAWSGGFWGKVWLGLNNPYLVIHRKDFLRVFNLARRRGTVFGEGDVAFYDFAESMLDNIHHNDLAIMNSEDFSEKGYINTFNHITAQAFLTSIFSEKFADFVADVHERGNMPELVTGAFSESQLIDLEKGPTDNYVDMINNEWGQELGKQLKAKYNISRETNWTPKLLVNYLNDIQAYYSWAFQIGFTPFKTTDQVVKTFTKKLNIVMDDSATLN